MNRRLFAVLTAFLLLLTGCNGGSQNKNADPERISIENEMVVKEFPGTVNVFHRAEDDIILGAEEDGLYKYYDINISSAQVEDSKLTEMSGEYFYQEPIGNQGFVVVEESAYKNTLKFVGRNGEERVIEEDIGPADAINISISPKAGKLAYTAHIEGKDIYGIYIYDIVSSKNMKIMEIKSDGFIEGFHYLVNWSPDESSVIVQDKYIYDAVRGAKKGEIMSAFSQWAPKGSKVAFVLEEEPQRWLPAADYHIYPGKKVCVYDVAKGSYNQVFEIQGDEFVFGGLTWDGEGRRLAFSGIKAGDTDQPDWYMKLNYSSVYIVDMEENRSTKLETNVDASDGSMIELANIKFTRNGNLLSYTVGNYENSSLHLVNTGNLEAETFENVEYLHWIDGENYTIPAEGDTVYFCMDNSIYVIDEKLEESTIYTSKTNLDDFYLSKEGKEILMIEHQEDVYTARYIGK